MGDPGGWPTPSGAGGRRPGTGTVAVPVLLCCIGVLVMLQAGTFSRAVTDGGGTIGGRWTRSSSRSTPPTSRSST